VGQRVRAAYRSRSLPLKIARIAPTSAPAKIPTIPNWNGGSSPVMLTSGPGGESHEASSQPTEENDGEEQPPAEQEPTPTILHRCTLPVRSAHTAHAMRLFVHAFIRSTV